MTDHAHNRIFRTVVESAVLDCPIHHSATLISVGSCFSSHISEYLTKFRFTLCDNPSGIVYNPASCVSTLFRARTNARCTRDQLIEHDGLYHHFQYHGSFSHPDPDQVCQSINRATERSHAYIETLDYLIITVGSAWVYRHREKDEIVSNCHKVPAHFFHRTRLTRDEIISLLAEEISELRAIRPDLHCILTVSPVRHWGDGAHENSVSKAELITAVDALMQDFPCVYYFPSYEILLDELRDYRFYTTDLIHPSHEAIEYIRSRFTESCVSAQSREFIKRYKPIISARHHRILHPRSRSAQKFCESQLRALESLSADYPTLDFNDDRSHFHTILNSGQ